MYRFFSFFELSSDVLDPAAEDAVAPNPATADEDAVAYGSPLISVEYDVTDDDYVTSSGAPSFMARGEEMGYVAKFSFEDLD